MLHIKADSLHPAKPTLHVCSAGSVKCLIPKQNKTLDCPKESSRAGVKGGRSQRGGTSEVRSGHGREMVGWVGDHETEKKFC